MTYSFPTLMKNVILPGLIALVVGAPELTAAPQIAETYEAAQAILQDDGYILFAYAEDWDTYSKEVCDVLMASPVVQQAAGNAVFMRVPIPDELTEERKKADAVRYGKLRVPDANNYPALLMLTKSGRHYATITGPYMMKADPEKVAAEISKALQSMRNQEELLTKAQSANGIEKAKLLGEAALIPGINPPDAPRKLIQQINKLDPRGETGYARKLVPPFDLSMEIFAIESQKDTSKPHGWETALKTAEKYLKDTVYTNEQRQALYAISIGILRRHVPTSAARIRKLARQMQKLDPDSDLGKSAGTVIREWGTGLTLAEGWTPGIIAEKKPVEVDDIPPFTKPGTYTFTLVRDRGNHNCNVAAISLYDGKKLIAEDRHEGFVGPNKSENTEYKLEVSTVPSSPHLFIQFNQKGSANNSWGHISLSSPQ